MTPPESGDVRIRNQRYHYWSAIAGVMLIACVLVASGLQFVDRQFSRPAFYCVFGSVAAMAVYCLRAWLIILSLQEGPLPAWRETARALWNWGVRGVRPHDPRRIGVSVVRTLFGWLAPRRISTDLLHLGDEVWFDPRWPIPVAAVARVRFAPDPAGDYAEPGREVYFCAAAVELNSGREFRLILDEVDVRRLREWATTKGIPVSDCDGYSPRTTEPTTEASAHE
jgi:hypothetical protein